MNINRRNFIKNTSLSAAGMMFIPSILRAEGLSVSDSKTNRNFCPVPFTLISIIEDSAMLTYMLGKLSEVSRNALVSDIHFRPTVSGNKGRMAGVLPPLDKRLLTLIKFLKNNQETEKYPAKLSVAMGWAVRNATHTTFLDFFEGKDPEAVSQSGIHMDATVMRHLSLPDFDPSRASAEEMEELLNIIVPRAITRTHTLKPDSDDGIGWVNRMSEKRRNMKNKFAHYASAMVKPDVKFLPPNFYDADDKIIQIARALQNAEKVRKEQITGIMDEKQTGKSLYGQTLNKSAHSILAINDFMEGSISDQQLEQQLFS